MLNLPQIRSSLKEISKFKIVSLLPKFLSSIPCFLPVCLLLVGFINSISLAQSDIDHKHDSLVSALTQKMPDTSKLKIHIWLMKFGSAESHERHKVQAQKMVAKLDDEKWGYHVKYAQVWYLNRINEIKEANKQIRELISSLKPKNYKALLAQCYMLESEILIKIGEFTKAKESAGHARSIFKKFAIHTELGRAIYFLSVATRNEGNPDLALRLIDTASQYIREHNRILRSSLYNNKGRIYRGMGNYDSAFVAYQTVLRIVKETDDQVLLSTTYNNLGNVAHSRGNLDSALAFYLKSLSIKEQLEDARGLCIAYHNVGTVRVDLKNFSQAEIDFQKSMQLADKLDFNILKVHNCMRLGNIFFQRKAYAPADSFYRQAITQSRSMNFTNGVIDGLINRADILKSQTYYTEAIDILLEGIALATSSKQKVLRGKGIVSLAEAYSMMQLAPQLYGNKVSVNYPNVDIEALFKQGAQLAQETGNYQGIESSLLALKRYYRNTNQYRKEADIAGRYIQFKDSLFNKQSAESLSELQTKYEVSQKEREIALLQKENELRIIKTRATKMRYYWILLSLGFLGVLGFMFFRNRQKRVRLAEIEALRTKISNDLHDDVGSMLTGLAMQSELLELTAAEKDRSSLQKIHEMSRDAMSRIRDAVWAMDANKDNWDALVDRMKDHAELLIGPSDFHYTFDIQTQGFKMLSPLKRQQLFLIYKEAVANAVKHSNGNKIDIQLVVEKQITRLLIKDNGRVESMKSSGLGINSMKKRAEKIDAELTLNTEDGFAVLVETK